MPSSGHSRKDQANPLHTPGASKGKVQERADQARTQGARTPTEETVTGQGGSTKDEHRRADSRHPGQRGGVHADDQRGREPEDPRVEKPIRDDE